MTDAELSALRGFVERAIADGERGARWRVVLALLVHIDKLEGELDETRLRAARWLDEVERQWGVER